ncbi:NAD-dependent epimerase/dehydratase family protein [Nocardia huaxiensis]|uniref:NAD(P)-dependent oxidoreductase n=1 Tax=Nocardia huaxiensis TaxID=2755382 RepID=A0A7D6ZQ74_9NOCA|nr:NAD(P)-dependent oxidoreductase [Nocardia huaxiensis]QLY31045.1 NAD(P)-dependent oxidoreductase [Nocardia huaxiensis]UFS94568.1 NAD(P)-dependent oxidoreductase [Nocardia huaxiensis]
MNDTDKKVLLAGASGVLGGHITNSLRQHGYQVVALGRGAGADIRADLMDRDQLLRAVDGLRIDTVVHAATALRKAPMRHRDMYATDDLRIAGTANLVEAAKAVGARRMIAESMVFGYGYEDFGDRVLTEADSFGQGGGKGVARHLEGMRVKEELMLKTPGIEGISLRFGIFYGPGGTEAIVDMLRKRQLPGVNDHGRVLPWVNLADAGAAVALAVEGGRPGAAYNIADDTPVGFGGHIRLVADTFHTPKPITLPSWLLTPMSYVHTITGVNMRVSTAKAKSELGWKPQYPACADGLRALAAA